MADTPHPSSIANHEAHAPRLDRPIQAANPLIGDPQLHDIELAG